MRGHFLIALTCFFAGLWKSYSLIFHEGRFWMEEGTFFFERICPRSFLGGFFYIHEGRLELPANTLVNLSRFVGLRYAPLVTTYGSLILQTLPILLLIAQRRRLGLGFFACASIIALSACLPQANEVWANTINLHFHFSLLVALILMLPTDQSKPWRWTLRGGVLLAGLSGAPANVLAPLFVWRAWREKNRERSIQAAILCATALLQLILQATATGVSPRQYSVNFELYGLIVATQQFFVPLLGLGHTTDLLMTLRRGHGSEFAALPLILAAIVGYAFLWTVVWRRRRDLAYGLGAAMLLVGLALITRRNDLADMTYHLRGLRYFFAPNMLLVIVTACLCSRPPGEENTPPAVRPIQRGLAIPLATWALYTGLLLNFAMPPQFASGPPWREQIDALEASPPKPGEVVRLDIWPTGVKMTLPAEYLHLGTHPSIE